ncbi:MAG: amidase, partial [Calditrichaeota bacterium]|nr:amidase [Calditrichota bacterium]
MRLIFLVQLLLLLSCDSVQKIKLNELTIRQIHQAYQNGDYTSEDLVNAYLQRIAEYNSQINAISIINPKAIEIARQLDAEFKSTGKLRPLHGIPMLVKDNINTVGLPTTAGSLALKDFIPDQNAPIIDKLVEAGAIIIAKTNMAEWAFSAKH